MLTQERFKQLVVILMLAVALAPADLFGAEPATNNRIIFVNVELSEQGELLGQVVSAEGKAQPFVPVLADLRTKQFRTTTDKFGVFKFRMVSGNSCVIRVGDSFYPCRTWKHGTAPPKSISRIALLHDNQKVVRGNIFGRKQCPDNCNCEKCQRQGMTSEKKYGLAILALGGGAAYLAISRENASE